MRSRNFPKVCDYCFEDFIGYRPSNRFCCNACRHAWAHRNASEKTIERKRINHAKWSSENWQHKRDYHIKRVYGLDAEQYQELLEKQCHSCGVCGRHETEFSRKLAVDHDHVTGEIFGLLCRECNHTLIGKQRSPDLFLKAAEYLKEGTGLVVPIKIKKKRKKRKCKIIKIAKK